MEHNKIHAFFILHVAYVCPQKDKTPSAGQKIPQILWNSKVSSYSKETVTGSYLQPNDNSSYRNVYTGCFTTLGHNCRR